MPLIQVEHMNPTKRMMLSVLMQAVAEQDPRNITTGVKSRNPAAKRAAMAQEAREFVQGDAMELCALWDVDHRWLVNLEPSRAHLALSRLLSPDWNSIAGEEDADTE